MHHGIAISDTQLGGPLIVLVEKQLANLGQRSGALRKFLHRNGCGRVAKRSSELDGEFSQHGFISPSSAIGSVGKAHTKNPARGWVGQACR